MRKKYIVINTLILVFSLLIFLFTSACIVSDLNCYSANYGCKAGVSTVTDETNYADRMSNYWCSGAMMYLYDCTSYGSKYDTAILNNGTIMSNTQYASNYQS